MESEQVAVRTAEKLLKVRKLVKPSQQKYGGCRNMLVRAKLIDVLSSTGLGCFLQKIVSLRLGLKTSLESYDHFTKM